MRERGRNSDLTHLTAGSGNGEFNVSGSLFLVIQVTILALQALNLLFEEKFGLDSGARDAAVAVPVRLAVQFITRGATSVRLF